MIALSWTRVRSMGLVGEGVRVAVVDSGVNGKHPHVSGLAGGVSIRVDDRGGVERGRTLDDLTGHGTACAAVVRWRAPGAQLHAVRVFHDDLRCHAVALLDAIRWCVEQRMDIVNLSLGTRDATKAASLAAECERAREAGVILVAAEKRQGPPSYPAALPCVVAATAREDCPQDIVLCDEATGRYQASGYPRRLPGIPRERNFHGESFAAAHVVGLLALVREACPADELDELQQRLICLGRVAAPASLSIARARGATNG